MKIAIFGASGLSREVSDIAVVLGYQDILLIDNIEKCTDCYPIVTEKEVYALARGGYRFAIGIGSPKIRRQIRGRYPDLEYINLIHPAATFGHGQLGKVEKEAGNIIFAGARMTNNIRVGNFGIYYLNCTVAHDCIIEDFITIASGANISGNVKISAGAYIGTNACILQGKSISEKMIIGKNSTVGAGAVVTKNVPDNTIVKGVPAR